MQVVLLRVGIDTASDGMLGPVFEDGTFEYVPIPDGHRLDLRTYGNMHGKHGAPLLTYFSKNLQTRYRHQPIHFDPEFKTFTYGDPTTPKASLRRLQEGDFLVFYTGLRGWDIHVKPGLYIIGYFRVLCAGLATGFSRPDLKRLFSRNFHVMHSRVFREQRSKLVLVKGAPGSQLLTKAVLISTYGKDRRGTPLKILSGRMQKVFGDFRGHVSIQRSPPRWVAPEFVEYAADFVTSLR